MEADVLPKKVKAFSGYYGDIFNTLVVFYHLILDIVNLILPIEQTLISLYSTYGIIF